MDVLIEIIEFIGIVSFSISGAIVAIDKEMDFVGVVIMSVLTSFGGGIMRDLVIGRTPVFFTSMPIEIAVSVMVAVMVFLFAKICERWYLKNEENIKRINNYIDALGLGAFAVSGVKICIDSYAEKGAFMAIMMGCFTAVGGGAIRDVCLRDVPFIFRKRIYAAAALAGSSLYYLFSEILLSDGRGGQIISLVIGVSTVVLIRVAATVFRLNFPRAIDFSRIEEESKNENENVEIHS